MSDFGRRWCGRILTAALALGGVPGEASAQYDDPPPPAAYALENVTVVRADGTRLDSVNLVVRGGLIEALGRDAPVPADAKVLEGDSLIVYPGLVDADGQAEVTWPDPRDIEDEDEITAWSPPRSRQGFMPHRRVSDHLALPGTELADLRAKGIVAALIHPEGGMAPGQAAVLVHRDAEMPWELVQDPSAGLTLTFRSAGGVYPSQLFGVIAFLRQAFLDAERWELMRAAEPNGGGFVAPGWDPDYEALRRVVRGEAPVFFRADTDEDIRRALDLSDQLGFRMVLVGGQEAWKLAGELADRNVAVLASLDFPRLTDWDPEEDTIPAELEPDAAREKERIENLWSNAARLDEAGVTFALTTGGGAADLLEGVRKAVEYGLTPEGALRAVTSAPAELLGIPRTVRVEPGLPATFLVADGELLDEETGVAYTFVEGTLTEGVARGGDGGGEEPAGDLGGSWSGEISVGGQEVAFELTLAQADDGSLTGTMSAAEMPTSPVTGSISGSAVTLRIEAEGMPEPIELSGTLSEDGNELSGSGSSSFGQMSFQATRDPGGGWAPLFGGAR